MAKVIKLKSNPEPLLANEAKSHLSDDAKLAICTGLSLIVFGFASFGLYYLYLKHFVNMFASYQCIQYVQANNTTYCSAVKREPEVLLGFIGFFASGGLSIFCFPLFHKILHWKKDKKPTKNPSLCPKCLSDGSAYR